MNLNQPTLIQFETERKQNNFIPPEGSNSFYAIGNGEINLLTKRSNPDDCRFDLFTNKGKVYTGFGNFVISGDINDPSMPYNDLTVIANTSLSINQILTISKGNLFVHGDLEIMQHGQLIIKDHANVVMYTDSKFTINTDTNIIVENGSSLTIYGQVNVHLSKVNSLVNVPGITIDSAAVINVDGMESLGKRAFSLTDYETYLRSLPINVHTQGEMNYDGGRIGYTWKDGDPKKSSQIIMLSILWGEAILGDFKLSILGLPDETIPNLQMISDIHIRKNTTLYITENYKGYKYIRPELYLGIVISNNKTPAKCIIDGTLIADGPSSFITVDRGASIYINSGAKLYLKNGAIMRSTHNEEDSPILFIDGTLIIDRIEQIDTFSHDNIMIGEKGKVIILNPDTGEKQLLWTTPNGIENTDLYRLFKDRIDQVEYHISNNTGIGIDKYYEYYARDMTVWYGGRRIEKAIHDGILVWHDGGFIELYHDITPWVNTECTLLQASRIFKTFGSYDEDKLQDAVNRLQYAGAGNILFRFIDGDNCKEVLLILQTTHMTNIINHPLSNMYTLSADDDGKLFLKNSIGHTTIDKIVNSRARQLDIIDNQVEFQLP